MFRVSPGILFILQPLPSIYVQTGERMGTNMFQATQNKIDGDYRCQSKRDL